MRNGDVFEFDLNKNLRHNKYLPCQHFISLRRSNLEIMRLDHLCDVGEAAVGRLDSLAMNPGRASGRAS